jgi:hypothetical protein
LLNENETHLGLELLLACAYCLAKPVSKKKILEIIDEYYTSFSYLEQVVDAGHFAELDRVPG